MSRGAAGGAAAGAAAEAAAAAAAGTGGIESYVIDVKDVEVLASSLASRMSLAQAKDLVKRVGSVDPDERAELADSGNEFTRLSTLNRNAVIPELKNLYKRLQEDGELTPAEKEGFFKSLVASLNKVSKNPTIATYLSEDYQDSFQEELATSPSRELMSFLSQFKKLKVDTREPAIASAIAAEGLMEGLDKTQLKLMIESKLRGYREKVKEQSVHDIKREGIKVVKDGRVLIFRNDAAFTQWGNETNTSTGQPNLTGEQIGFIRHYTDQGNLIGASMNALIAHNVSDSARAAPYPIGNSNFEPAIMVNIEGDRVSITHQTRYEGVADKSPVALASFSADISGLRGDEFLPGLGSTRRVEFVGKITSLDTNKLRLAVPESIGVIIDTPEPLQEYCNNKIKSAMKPEEILDVIEPSLPALGDPLSRETIVRFGTPAGFVASKIPEIEASIQGIREQFGEASIPRDAMAKSRASLLRISSIFAHHGDVGLTDRLNGLRAQIFESIPREAREAREEVIGAEAKLVKSFAEAQDAIRLGPESDIYKANFANEENFSRLCIKHVTEQITDGKPLTQEKTEQLRDELTRFNELVCPGREIFPVSLIMRLAKDNHVRIDNSSYMMSGAARINRKDTEYSPADIFLGETPSGVTRARAARVARVVGEAGSALGAVAGVVGEAGSALSRSRVGTFFGGVISGVSSRFGSGAARSSGSLADDPSSRSRGSSAAEASESSASPPPWDAGLPSAESAARWMASEAAALSASTSPAASAPTSPAVSAGGSPGKDLRTGLAEHSPGGSQGSGRSSVSPSSAASAALPEGGRPNVKADSDLISPPGVRTSPPGSSRSR